MLLGFLKFYRLPVFKPWKPHFDIRHPPSIQDPEPEKTELEELVLNIETVKEYRSECMEILAQSQGIPYGYDTFV